jgi:hypothetical protein
MADGSTTGFEELETGGYQSVKKVGALTITTTYDGDLQKEDVVIEKAYENVLELSAMSENFQAAWQNVIGFLPSSFTANPVQFAEDRGHLVVIATADSDGILNGDVVGRIGKWSNEENPGTWQRWFNNQAIEVQNVEWNYNFNDADWNRLAEYGERKVTFEKDGFIEVDEIGTNVSSVVRKDASETSVWENITSIVSNDTLAKINVSVTWDDVSYVELQKGSWNAQKNSYRGADELWSGSDDRTFVYGELNNSDDTVFFGTITKRDGFIVLRDNSWNEIARLIDPAASSEDTSYEAMVEKYGEAFDKAWNALGDELPDVFKDVDGNTIEKSLLYTTDKWGNILVFSKIGEMIGEINTWSNSDTWERGWDDEYMSETHSNINFGFRVLEADGRGGQSSIDVGRYEEGSNTYHGADGQADVVDRTWERVSKTVYERNVSEEAWAAQKANLLDVVAEELKITGDDGDRKITWDDVNRIEVSSETYTHFETSYRDDADTDISSNVQFFTEVSMNDGDWYATNFLGGFHKGNGFIEIQDSNWQTIARVADPASLEDWSKVAAANNGLKEAWADVKFFLPTELQSAEALKFTSDENNIYAFTAAGVMVGNINYWSNSHEWESYYDGKVTVRNLDYNYNWNDADWTNLANSGGYDHYIVETDGAGLETLIHDETGSNTGVRIYKSQVAADVWSSYDPGDSTGTIDWDAITDIQYEVRTNESISNKYRGDDRDWQNSNAQTQYFKEVVVDGQSHGWSEFVGIVEERDGFIEIRDEYWDVVAQRIDPDSNPNETSYVAMMQTYGSAFSDAWDAVSSYLPSVFKDDNGATIEEDLKYTADKWGNILVFDAVGDMIGEIGFWSHSDTWDTSWDKEYTSETQQNSNFRFTVLEKSNGNRDFVDVAEYRESKSELIDSEGVKETDRESTGVSSTQFKRSTSEEGWSAVGTEHFLSTLTDELSFEWKDVDRIEVGTRETTNYNVRWDGEKNDQSEKRIKFYSEIEMNEGDWYATEMLGALEYRDGLIEIIDENWEVVAKIVDPSNTATWAQIIENNAALDWAWDQVKYNLPIDAQDPTQLTFAEEEGRGINAFDSSGNLILHIGRWSNGDTWPEGTVTKTEHQNGYNFQDSDNNRIAEADISKSYVSDDSHPDAVIDRTWQNVSVTIKKEDLSAEKWDEYNPGDTTGTINWEAIVEISVGVNEYEGFKNFYRNDSYVGSSERIEYRIEVGDAWGTWTERVAITEREGNLMTIRDGNWDHVGQIVVGDPETVALKNVLDATDAQIMTQYGDIIAKYFDVETVELIQSDSGPGILVNDGEIVGTVERWENWEDNGERLYVDYNIRDTNDDNLLRLGGWNQAEKAYDDSTLIAEKPNGVKIAEFHYKDDYSDEEWKALEDEYSIEWKGFDWSKVGILETQIWNNAWRSDQEYQTRNEVRFIEVDEDTGRENWSYFAAVRELPIITVKDGDWNTLGTLLDAAADLTDISDQNDAHKGLDEFNEGFYDLVKDTGVLDRHVDSGKLTFLTDNESGNLLLVRDTDIRAVVTDVSKSWGDAYGVLNGFEFRTSDDSYMGWMASQNVDWNGNPHTDTVGNEFPDQTKVTSNMRINLDDGTLPLEAWEFLNHVFSSNRALDHNFYDLEAVYLREEQILDEQGDPVSHLIMVQHSKSSGWEERIGFDLVNKKLVSQVKTEQDEGPDLKVTDTSLDMSQVLASFTAVRDYYFSSIDILPDDLLTVDVNPDENTEIVVNTALVEDAYDDLDTLLEGANAPQADVSVSEDGSEFSYKLGNHEVEISSSIFGVAGSLKDYIEDNSSVDFVDVVDYVDSFVIAAIEADGNLNLSDVDFNATYAFGDDTILSMSIDDLQAHDNNELIEGSDGDIFLVDVSQDGTVANLYTPDDAVSIQFDQIDSVVAEVKLDNTSLTDEEAINKAISYAMEEVLSFDDQTDPFFV